ncbi:DUF3545 family protein [Gallaecimonas sp. GXIMD4217]|uniref:DUF3545 family protein n=1 Tax=Gallaecimonas sp. GXIMD4217 TaxID=3131927 RepID=UPI00311ABF66
MDQVQDMQGALSGDKRETRGRNKKRRWREIEAIKERFRLKKELEDIDWSHDYRLEELEF